MNSLYLALIASALALAFFLIVKSERGARRQNKSEGVDIEAGASDPELAGVVSTVTGVDYPGSLQYEGGKAIARYDARGDGQDVDGKIRVSKWILARHGAYYKLRGHDVLYEYFREDGSLERDRLVEPEAGLGGGIYTKERQRFFELGPDGERKLVRSLWFREDGTLGLVSNEITGVFQRFRLDGKALHSEYFKATKSDGAPGQRSVFYRLDGKTVWMEKDADDRARVYFDLDGNPCDLHFKRERAIGSFSMGPDAEPLLTGYDKFERVGLDGLLSPDYDQTWYTRWDKAAGTAADTLGAVVVYDAFGKKRSEFMLALLPAGEPRFITEAIHYNGDGSILTRKYRAPGCRSLEVVVGPGVNQFDFREFGEGDTFDEDADDILFQGFMRNIYGTYDDESHDI